MADQEISLTGKAFDRLQRVVTYVEAMMRANIPGGSNGPNGPRFPGLPALPSQPPRPPDDVFVAKITGSTQDGSNKRCKYSFEEQTKKTADYGTSNWEKLNGGRTGSSSDSTAAYNLVENINGSSGTFGNGVASTNLTGTLTVKAVPDNVLVLMKMVVLTTSSGTAVEYWFQYENGIDGGC